MKRSTFAITLYGVAVWLFQAILIFLALVALYILVTLPSQPLSLASITDRFKEVIGELRSMGNNDHLRVFLSTAAGVLSTVMSALRLLRMQTEQLALQTEALQLQAEAQTRQAYTELDRLYADILKLTITYPWLRQTCHFYPLSKSLPAVTEVDGVYAKYNPFEGTDAPRISAPQLMAEHWRSWTADSAKTLAGIEAITTDYRVAQYDSYAFLVWNFLETLHDRCEEDPSLLNTWAPIVTAENAIHRGWFLAQIAIELDRKLKLGDDYVPAHKFCRDFQVFVWNANFMEVHPDRYHKGMRSEEKYPDWPYAENNPKWRTTSGDENEPIKKPFKDGPARNGTSLW